MRTLIKLTVFISAISSFTILYYWRSRDVLMQWKYDISKTNIEVVSHQHIDSLLSQLKVVPNTEIDDNYLSITKFNTSPFTEMLGEKKFYKIEQEGIYQFIVGKVRIKDLLPKDNYYKQALYSKDSLYWLMDQKVLHLMLDFQQEIVAQNGNPNQLKITNGYRHPLYNEEVGGASQSRHIVGEAIDITAKDANNDGVVNQDDKAFILAIAEKVVGDKGGVGLYPGTMSIHIDVRGYKARWETY